MKIENVEETAIATGDHETLSGKEDPRTKEGDARPDRENANNGPANTENAGKMTAVSAGRGTLVVDTSANTGRRRLRRLSPLHLSATNR